MPPRDLRAYLFDISEACERIEERNLRTPGHDD
jgi:hypothetical protein